MTTTNGSIDLAELARFQRDSGDELHPFTCVRCQDGIARQDAAQGPEGVLCPQCADHEIRMGGRVNFR